MIKKIKTKNIKKKLKNQKNILMILMTKITENKMMKKIRFIMKNILMKLKN